MPVWPDDAATRQLALSLGRAHADAVAALRRVGASQGGGLFGVVKGVLAEYERLGYLTAADGMRPLTRPFDRSCPLPYWGQRSSVTRPLETCSG
jgi:hypothetical protein